MRGQEITHELVEKDDKLTCRICEQSGRARRMVRVNIGPYVSSHFCEYCVGEMRKVFGPEPVKVKRSQRPKKEQPCPVSP